MSFSIFPSLGTRKTALITMRKLKSLRYRQVHLDFHTSPDIDQIGVAFNVKEWQETLKRARVNSITCFSKCHHGLSYHPTEVGTMHPHLQFDLLRAQMNACKEIDVRVPVYLSAGLDNTITKIHPEWREVNAQNQWSWTPQILLPGFHKLCFNTPYLDYLCDQIREAVRLFPEADGIFLDIIYQNECCCNWCMESMSKSGLDARKESDRKFHAARVLDEYFRRTTAAAQELNPDMPVFHNSSHITRGRRDQVAYQTHLELESLPTGGWGYDHFPESASYSAYLGRDFLGMTGKFHTSWGEFGGFKHPNALRYECSVMNAFGAKCSIGDQLHPDGKLDISTYDEIIRPAFEEVEAREPWCTGAVQLTDIAVLSSEAENGKTNEHSRVDTGVCRLLLEGHHLFSLIDRDVDFSRFKLLILPDEIRVDASLQAKINTYLCGGGKLLLSASSGLKAEGGFVFDVGAQHKGESEFTQDYILPAKVFCPAYLRTPLVMYTRSQRIIPTTGKSLGEIYDPYFNRDFRHFCSHQHAPNRPVPSGFHCGVQQGNIAYLAHPVFTLYYGYGATAYKDYILAIIDSLLGDARTVRTNMPSTARMTFARQEDMKRRVLHLLYANKILRGAKVQLDESVRETAPLEIIENLDPLLMVQVSVNYSANVRRITLEPQGQEIAFTRYGNHVQFEIDRFFCNQIISLHE